MHVCTVVPETNENNLQSTISANKGLSIVDNYSHMCIFSIDQLAKELFNIVFLHYVYFTVNTMAFT